MKQLILHSEQKWLFRIAAWSAVMTVLLVPISLYVFAQYPPPYDGAALGWFNVFHKNVFVGLGLLQRIYLSYRSRQKERLYEELSCL